LDHPVMRQLVARLVWWTAAPSGADVILFQPTDQGQLMDLRGAPVAPPPEWDVGLAHRADAGAEQSQAWSARLRQQAMEPLFSQFEAAPPAFAAGAARINDHAGWGGDAVSLKAIAAGRGYRRGQTVDGPFYLEFVKSIGEVVVHVGISGAEFPETRQPTRVTDLTFSGRAGAIELADLPPALLAEAYADYLRIAAEAPDAV
jgi:hypothetical protein